MCFKVFLDLCLEHFKAENPRKSHHVIKEDNSLLYYSPVPTTIHYTCTLHDHKIIKGHREIHGLYHIDLSFAPLCHADIDDFYYQTSFFVNFLVPFNLRESGPWVLSVFGQLRSSDETLEVAEFNLLVVFFMAF